METTLRIHTDLLSNSLIENIQKMFPHKEVKISIQESTAKKIEKKEMTSKRKHNMSFAGSFSDMRKADFEGFKRETKQARKNLFDRKFEI